MGEEDRIVGEDENRATFFRLTYMRGLHPGRINRLVCYSPVPSHDHAKRGCLERCVELRLSTSIQRR